MWYSNDESSISPNLCRILCSWFVDRGGIHNISQLHLQMGSCSQQLATKWPEIYGHLIEFTP